MTSTRRVAIVRSAAACALLGALACSSSITTSKNAAAKPSNTSTNGTAGAGAGSGAGASTGAGAGASAGAGAAPKVPFAPVSPAVYVAKVKNVLLGLPPSDDEVARVAADPTQLRALIGQWMTQPEYTQKMQRFFELAFQQTQISTVDFADQSYPRQISLNSTTTPLLVQNAQQSFARTALQLIAEGRPLTEAVTTRRFMLTTAMKELYAFLDVWEVDNAGKVTDRFKKANPNLSIVAEAAQGPIPIAQTLDPSNANYMHWYDPDVATAGAQTPGCMQDPIVYPSSAIALHYLLYGSLDNRKVAAVSCNQTGGSATAAQLTTDDFNDWHMVTVREPKAGEATTLFYDLPALRSATELVLSIPRVGFYSTPAFFANWQTNISNQMRVTLNQTLIVALGSSVDGTDTTMTPGSPPPGLDDAHASSSDCFSCHQTLDPLRSIFAASYSWNYHNQLDTSYGAQKGMFSFRGVIAPVASMSELGDQLAQHPLFATAWTQKLCYYANSAACSETDPEVQRIARAFQSANYDWNMLVTELLSSPITTYATETSAGASQTEIVAVTRRDHLCAALDNRLGLADVCGLDVVAGKKAKKTLVATIAAGLPSDGYGRGSTVPVLPNQPTLFFRAGTENICESIAASVIDVPAAKQVAGVKQWSSKMPTAAIADFVSVLMGLVPSDPRAAKATDVLAAHFTTAMQQGANASDALKSTFITACLGPSFVSIGL